MNIIREFFRGRLLGHPIHAMLVHFPSALFPTAALFQILAWALQQSLFALIAFYLLGLGVVFGILAACFGAIDYANLPSTHRAWKLASIHAVLNVLWIMIFGTMFGIQMVNYPSIKIPDLGQTILSVLTVVGLVVSNYFGGELVYRHRVGAVDPNDL